jgi:acyl-CoA thioesterase
MMKSLDQQFKEFIVSDEWYLCPINFLTMSTDILAQDVVKYLLLNDPYSKWLGISLEENGEGYCKIKMTIRPEMLNGLGIVHGGIPFALADTAFGLASNNRNNQSVALDCSITFIKTINTGDVLTAEAREIHNGRSTGVYVITIMNQEEQQVALFKGTCFRTAKKLIDAGSL